MIEHSIIRVKGNVLGLLL